MFHNYIDINVILKNLRTLCEFLKQHVLPRGKKQETKGREMLIQIRFISNEDSSWRQFLINRFMYLKHPSCRSNKLSSPLQSSRDHYSITTLSIFQNFPSKLENWTRLCVRAWGKLCRGTEMPLTMYFTPEHFPRHRTTAIESTNFS